MGAQQGAVVREVMGRALLPVGLGLVLGFTAALGGTRLLDSLLFEVQPRDPMVLIVVTLALAGAALAASFSPARRAASIDPASCLNSD